MNENLKNIQVRDASGNESFYSGDYSGLEGMGNSSVYNVPVGNGQMYSGIASGLSAYRNANKMSQTVGASTPTYTPYASDSSSVVAGENKTMADLQTYTQTGPNVDKLIESSQSSIADIDKYLKELAARRESEVAGIKSTYAGLEDEMKTAQKSEAGATNTALTTKLGGYLGGSASHVGMLNNMAASHRAELGKLASKRDAAIQQAQNAITDKEFAVARMKTDEIKSLNNEIYKRQQDFFDNALKLQQEGRSERESLTKGYKDYLDTLAGAAGSDSEVMLDPQRAAEIDSFYGVSGFTANYLDAARKSASAKNEKERFDAFKSYLNLLQDIPAGVEVPFGDETVVGIGKTSDISTYMVTDKASGKQYIAAYNKGSGEMSLSFTGTYGSKDTSGIDKNIKNNLITNATRMIANLPRTDSGKISASGYLAMRQKFIEEGVEDEIPGSLSYIDEYFLGGDSKDVDGIPLGTAYFDPYDIAYLQRELGIGSSYGLMDDTVIPEAL